MKLDAEILVEYPADWVKSGINPKWVECHRNLGRQPAAWEFMLWNSARIREFAADPQTAVITEQRQEEYRKKAGRGWSSFSTVGCLFVAGHLTREGHVVYDKWLKDNAGKEGWNSI